MMEQNTIKFDTKLKKKKKKKKIVVNYNFTRLIQDFSPLLTKSNTLIPNRDIYKHKGCQWLNSNTLCVTDSMWIVLLLKYLVL